MRGHHFSHIRVVHLDLMARALLFGRAICRGRGAEKPPAAFSGALRPPQDEQHRHLIHGASVDLKGTGYGVILGASSRYPNVAARMVREEGSLRFFVAKLHNPNNFAPHNADADPEVENAVDRSAHHQSNGI
eukprot:scaffold47230_cov32-Tisochrysis_lutea.AAC.1